MLISDRTSKLCEERLDVEALQLLADPNPVISIVGGGGKTTLLFLLAEYYAKKGCKVVVTTTTHILRPEQYPVANQKDALMDLFETNHIVVVGADAGNEKLKQSNLISIEECSEIADLVLIEADGAKCMPCKAPAAHEPVISKNTTAVLAVLGMSAYHRPLREVCFRLEEAKKLLLVESDTALMTEDVICQILSSEQGMKKAVGKRRYGVILNQCEERQLFHAAQRIKRALKDDGIEMVQCVSLRKGVMTDGT